MTRAIGRREMMAGGIALIAASAAGAVPAARRDWSRLDALCRSVIADRIAPGLALAATRGGRFVYSKGFGLANIETASPVTPQTVFRAGSITKQFTAAAIGLLQEDGKLAFDDRLARFLPDFPRADQVTLRQMLNHTSGFGDYMQMTLRPATAQSARLDFDGPALLDLLRNSDPLFVAAPGTAWHYSNTAYVLLGIVIERASGQSYAGFCQKRLFDPLGLAHSAIDRAPDVVRNRATGYSARAAAPSGFDNAAFISLSHASSAGALRTTAEDLCRWQDALFGGRVLKPATLAAMTTPVRLPDGALPTRPGGPGAKGPIPIEYGFGLGSGSFEGHNFFGHNGSINGFAADARSFPAERVSIAFLLNADSPDAPPKVATLIAIKDLVARIALR